MNPTANDSHKGTMLVHCCFSDAAACHIVRRSGKPLSSPCGLSEGLRHRLSLLACSIRNELAVLAGRWPAFAIPVEGRPCMPACLLCSCDVGRKTSHLRQESKILPIIRQPTINLHHMSGVKFTGRLGSSLSESQTHKVQPQLLDSSNFGRHACRVPQLTIASWHTELQDTAELWVARSHDDTPSIVSPRALHLSAPCK